MPQVKVSHEIKGKRKEVYEAVKIYLDGKETLDKLGAKMVWNDKACEGTIEAGNFSGSLEVCEKSGQTNITIAIDLPLLLSPFKGKVADELKKHLSRVKV